MSFSPSADELVGRNRSYAESFDDSALEVHPTRQLALVTCMDSRIDAFQVLGYCGLQNLDEAAFRDEIEAETGVKPWWSLEAFTDPFTDVRQSMVRIAMTPFIPYKDQVRGFVYDVTDGLLKEVRTD